MKDLSSVQLDVLEFMLRNRSARDNQVAKGLGKKPEAIKQEIAKLIQDGWLEERYRVPDDKLEALGYNLKCQANLWLCTDDPRREKQLPEADKPQSLAVALVFLLVKEFGKKILVGRLYAAFGGRLDATFSLRCKSAETQKAAKHFLENLPGVERVTMYREMRIG